MPKRKEASEPEPEPEPKKRALESGSVPSLKRKDVAEKGPSSKRRHVEPPRKRKTVVEDSPPSKRIALGRDSYSDIFDDVLKLSKERMAAYREKNGFVRVKDTVQHRFKNVDSAKILGRAKFNFFEDNLENGYEQKMGYFQRLFAKEVVMAMAPGIFGPDLWQKIGPDLMKSRGWINIYPLTVGIAPRQFGKSTVTARLLSSRSATFIKYPGREDDVQVVFSAGQRASDLLRDKFVQNLVELGLEKYAFKKTQEIIKLRAPGSTTVQSCYFLPSNADKTRGVTANVMIGEEAIKIDPKVWYETMIPLIENGKCATILISSPADSSNYVSNILVMRGADGALSNNVVDMDMVCKRCRDDERPEACRHNMKYYPPGKDSSKQDFISGLYGDRKRTFLRESLGSRIEANDSMFARESIDFLFNVNEFRVPDHFRFDDIVMVCDPNAHNSAASSEMFLIAIGIHAGTYMIDGFIQGSDQGRSPDHADVFCYEIAFGYKVFNSKDNLLPGKKHGT